MRVVVAEDDPAARRLLERLVSRWGYGVVTCSDGAEAWRVLRKRHAPRLAILDWMMPGMNGPEVCCELRQQDREDYVYVILLTSRDGTEDIVAGLDAGADDYLAKPFDPSELRVRLRAGRRIIDLQDELLATREALRQQATHDPLTGLWNRTAIFELLHAETARAARSAEPLSVLIADIDHFKRVNDTYGHMAGDVVLRAAAERLASSIRPYDSAARYGGEEFLCVLPRCTRGEAAGVAERVRSAIADGPMDVLEGPLSITMSLGVATAGMQVGGDALVRAADAALYQAKHAGRNRVVAAEAEPRAAKAPPQRRGRAPAASTTR